MNDERYEDMKSWKIWNCEGTKMWRHESVLVIQVNASAWNIKMKNMIMILIEIING